MHRKFPLLWKSVKIDTFKVVKKQAVLQVSYSWYRIPVHKLVKGRFYFFEDGGAGIAEYRGEQKFVYMLTFMCANMYLDKKAQALACRKLGIIPLIRICSFWSEELLEYGIPKPPPPPPTKRCCDCSE
jgi:hypothetical protein